MVTNDEAARAVRVARASSNLTQPELADELGISVASVRRTEQGHRVPTVMELEQIAQVCGVALAWMLDGGKGGNTQGHILARVEVIEARLEALERK